MKSVHVRSQVHTITIELDHIELASFIATLTSSIHIIKSSEEPNDPYIEEHCKNLDRLKSIFASNSIKED